MKKRLEFHISYTCRNNCFFCSEYNQIKRFGGAVVPLSIIKKVLTFHKRKGFNHLTLTGGEPSTHPDILKILLLAKFLGYTVYLGTNGGNFQYDDFCQKALPLIDELSFSIHGSSSSQHNSITGNEDSYGNLMLAIKNASKFKNSIYFQANAVATNVNFSSLSNIIKFIIAQNIVSQILISNIAPEGQGKKRYKELAVRLNKWRKVIPGLIGFAKQKKVQLNFFGLPFCVMSGYLENSNDTWWTPRTTVELWKKKNRNILKVTESFKPDREREKTNICQTCELYDTCSGTFSEYIKIYGETELLPVTIKKDEKK